MNIFKRVLQEIKEDVRYRADARVYFISCFIFILCVIISVIIEGVKDTYFHIGAPHIVCEVISIVIFLIGALAIGYGIAVLWKEPFTASQHKTLEELAK